MSPGDVPPAFGRFQLLQVVRQDGATTLHDAFDPELGLPVALITSPVGADLAEEDRLAFRLPRMRHPNIVSVLDAGRQGDVVFVAAECVETEPLSAFLARVGRIPVHHGLALVVQLLFALDHAHARRMVHGSLDLKHVQVTRTGQLKLPPAWSLSSDRHPNLEAAARIAQVLLSGVCGPQLRSALDEVLARALAPAVETRYQRADEFALALLATAGPPVWFRHCEMELAAPAEPEVADAVPASAPDDAPAPTRAVRKPLHRRRAVRSLAAAACAVAVLLVPNLIGNQTLTGGKDWPRPGMALAPAAPKAPEAAAEPVRVALSPAPPSPVEAIPAPPAPIEPAAAEPAPAVPAFEEPAAAPRPAVAPKTKPATAAPQPSTHAKPAAPNPHAKATVPAKPPVRTARPRPAPTVTAASGCPYDLRLARDLCVVQQCTRPELRNTPLCVRTRAEQRAALARLQGTPD